LPEIVDKPGLPPSAHPESYAPAIALVGFMGAGKTTVGQALAERLGWRFADLDQLIEERCGSSIPEIFRRDGEKIFRHLEYSVLSDTIEKTGFGRVVLALGGGAFQAEKIRTVLQAALIPAVWLDAPLEELYQRCDQPGIVRPLRTSLEEFRQLHEKRRSSYEKALLRISTGGKEIAAIVEEIISGLKVSDGGVRK
jgi:shikimate kinase